MPEAFKKNTALNATNLRIGLFVSMVVILGLTGAGFWFANQHLLTYAEEISKKKIDAQASNSSVSTLEKIQSDLDSYRAISEKISQLRASNDLPEFKIVEEIQRIARKNQIQISNYSYGSDSSGAASSTTPTAGGTTAPTTAPTAPAAGGAATPATANGKSISLTVNIASPVNYRNYLQFLYDIEQNIPKMQIKSVGISRGGGSSDGGTPAANTGTTGTPPVSSAPADADSVSVEPLIVEMYTR